MTRTVRTYAALVAVLAAFGVLAGLLLPNPASAATRSASGRLPHTCAAAGLSTADRTWLAGTVGCATDLPAASAEHLLLLREDTCDALRADVPAATIVALLADDLGDRTDAVTVFTAASVWCYDA